MGCCLQVSLQHTQNNLGNGHDSLKTLETTASRSPTPNTITSPVGRTSMNAILDPNVIHLDGLGAFKSMPTNHPLCHQLDVGLGSQSLLLARYHAALISNNNHKKGFAIQSTPFTSPCFSGYGTTVSPNNYGKKSCSLAAPLPQSQDVNLGRMLLLLSSGQQVTTPPMTDLQARLSSRYAKNETVIEREPPFPEKLHRLLRDVETLGRSDVISFVADDTFRIHDPVIFFHDVLPQYFRQTKLSSFKRQLKLYGFELVNKGPTIGGYRHKLFSRRDPILCRGMKRVAIKSRQPSSANDDTPCTKTSAN